MASRFIRIIPGFALAVLLAAAASTAPALAAGGGGAQLWAAVGSRGIAHSVAVSPDGSRVFATGDSGTVAYAASTGTQLWEASFAGSLRAVAVSPDGSRVFSTGKTTGSDGLPDYTTAAYDAATGSQLWAATYSSGVTGGDAAFAVGVSPDSTTVYVTGSSDNASGSTSDYATVAYDATTGKQQWAARYAGPGLGSSLATAIGVSRDGTRVFVTGPVPSNSDPYTDYATVGYDATTGKQLWVTRFDDGNTDAATAAGVSPDGTRVFVTGYSHSATGTDYATVGYDATTGNQLWVARYTSAALAASSLAAAPDGTMVIMAGTSAAGSAATVGYDATTGKQLWAALYNGPCNRGTQADAVAVSPDSTRAFVTGSALTGSCSYRPTTAYATVAYSTR